MENEETAGMTFEQTVSTFDYGRAVVMFQKRLPVSFWKKMTIHEQVLVYTASSSTPSNELAKVILHKLASMAIDFATWQQVYGWAPPNSDLQALARAKMVELATTVEEWEVVYLLGPSDGDHKKIALERISRLSTTKKIVDAND